METKQIEKTVSLGQWEVIPYGLVEVFSSGEAVLANGATVRLPSRVFKPIQIMSRGT